MSVFDALSDQCIAIDSSADSKDSALRIIARLARNHPSLSQVSEDTIFKALQNREKIGTTGFGAGIAIPHCALEGIDQFVVGILIDRDGTPFDALDGKPAKILVFIIGPKEQRNEHIHLLSSISRVLNTKGAIDELLSANDPGAVRENFLRHSTDALITKKHKDRSLFHVVVQKEEYLDEILRVFSELEDSSVTVVEGNDASHYLDAVPLFSGFLSDKKKGYNRLVLAIVNQALTNEALRQITNTIGDLHEAQGIMVMVQDLVFCAGTLNF
ncbi:MAG: PTS sugar transporter subunit IIA [Chitinivibrionales bacterium]